MKTERLNRDKDDFYDFYIKEYTGRYSLQSEKQKNYSKGKMYPDKSVWNDLGL